VVYEKIPFRIQKTLQKQSIDDCAYFVKYLITDHPLFPLVLPNMFESFVALFSLRQFVLKIVPRRFRIFMNVWLN